MFGCSIIKYVIGSSSKEMEIEFNRRHRNCMNIILIFTTINLHVREYTIGNIITRKYCLRISKEIYHSKCFHVVSDKVQYFTMKSLAILLICNCISISFLGRVYNNECITC